MTVDRENHDMDLIFLYTVGLDSVERVRYIHTRIGSARVVVGAIN